MTIKDVLRSFILQEKITENWDKYIKPLHNCTQSINIHLLVCTWRANVLDDIALTGGFSWNKGHSVKKCIKNAENKDFL